MKGFVYACLFSNGHIKVGRSIAPDSRIASHADRVACVGIELVDRAMFATEYQRSAEARLIQRCIDACDQKHKNEWFSGLDFEAVCAWARIEAEQATPETEREGAAGQVERACAIVGGQAVLARAIGVAPSFVNQMAHGSRGVGYINAVSIERATDGAVTRRDLRPDDWHLIWPELAEAATAPVRGEAQGATHG